MELSIQRNELFFPSRQLTRELAFGGLLLRSLFVKLGIQVLDDVVCILQFAVLIFDHGFKLCDFIVLPSHGILAFIVVILEAFDGIRQLPNLVLLIFQILLHLRYLLIVLHHHSLLIRNHLGFNDWLTLPLIPL